MFDCHACLRQCLRALSPDKLPIPRLGLRHRAVFFSSRHRPVLRSRGYATAFPRRVPSTFSAQAAVEEGEPWKGSKQAEEQKQLATATAKRDRDAVKDERALRKELEYLKDPLELANYVRKMLAQGKEQKAADIVRLASKDRQCTVSWNHLIDYEMSKGRVNAAFKTYNDMKKRAQTPDSYTYLLLFRGLANNAQLPSTVGRALALYHSMSAENSKVQPTTLHTNAVLKVCARAGDMDAMWGIASNIPERGAGAADNLTFTTILNAVRQTALGNTPKEYTEDQIARRLDKSVVDARRIWEDIVGKWRKGDIFIDEEIVCAMGRVLLIGSRPRDWDDVLSLVEQTMNIPRLIPRLGTAARALAPIPRIRAPHTPADMKNDNHELPTDEPVRGDEFNAIDISQSVGRKGRSIAYAEPGRSTLSLILEATLKTVAKQAAVGYWNLLTGPDYNIKPDLENLHSYLRLLRQSRSSAEALAVVKNDMHGRGLPLLRKTFRIAMSTCVRDKNNPNAMDTAGQLLDLMTNTLDQVDVKTLEMYLELAGSARNGKDVLRALNRLEPSYINLRSMVNFGIKAPVAPRPGEKPGANRGRSVERNMSAEETDAALGVVKKMIRCYDRLMNRGEIEREMYGELTQRRSKLAAWVSRWANRADEGKKRAEFEAKKLSREKRQRRGEEEAEEMGLMTTAM
ncbi:hypothetical protein H2201_005549 [Coniosporium apollinis]|uniref:Pentatricopeptide repeat protein n=1 Tax=Coniosporium apollinis TaxID=61459 RepID=A0ABQ9NPI0_9PEZI|nr:hypothetical protein H2201_005549 [Coniosporium apollinis]